MNLYLDSSTVVKLYVRETGSETARQAVNECEVAATSLVTRAEVSAALAKAVRRDVLDEDAAEAALARFRGDWNDLVRIRVSESLVATADSLAQSLGLRGYDSVQLAAALSWRDALDAPVTFATWDRELHAAAEDTGLRTVPASFA